MDMTSRNGTEFDVLDRLNNLERLADNDWYYQCFK